MKDNYTVEEIDSHPEGHPYAVWYRGTFVGHARTDSEGWAMAAEYEAERVVWGHEEEER